MRDEAFWDRVEFVRLIHPDKLRAYLAHKGLTPREIARFVGDATRSDKSIDARRCLECGKLLARTRYSDREQEETALPASKLGPGWTWFRYECPDGHVIARPEKELS